ncbi:Conserved_hypothetical protein [Hexamita inflata]|uniref:Uncharacterized protein n=1 Tax=Hexamita inflata TaxID=28002 RepID=A0AA86QRU8_9EUKA|nr:Conserved hypothetical protein [Hexamita inflata]CAI9959552.1 Conserved hypothetical protein [Hexamita inflata]
MLNIQKLDPFNGIYLSIKPGKIKVTDKQLKVLSYYKFSFDQSLILNDINYQNTKKYTPQLFQPVLISGSIYCQFFDTVYKLSKQQLERVVDIPESQNIIGNIFSKQDRLFVQTKNGVYVLQDNQFVFYKQISGQFFQFCNEVFVFNTADQSVFKLTDDFQLELICQVVNSYDVHLCSGGILVIKQDGFNNYTCVDMINGKSTVVKHDSSFSEQNINKYLHLGSAGIQLYDKIMVRLFGEDFPKLVKVTYTQYLINQTYDQPQYINGIKEIISIQNQKQYQQNQKMISVKTGICKIRSQFKQLKQLNQSSQIQVLEKIQPLTEKLQVLTNRFVSLAQDEVCQ